MKNGVQKVPNKAMPNKSNNKLFIKWLGITPDISFGTFFNDIWRHQLSPKIQIY